MFLNTCSVKTSRSVTAFHRRPVDQLFLKTTKYSQKAHLKWTLNKHRTPLKVPSYEIRKIVQENIFAECLWTTAFNK